MTASCVLAGSLAGCSCCPGRPAAVRRGQGPGRRCRPACRPGGSRRAWPVRCWRRRGRAGGGSGRRRRGRGCISRGGCARMPARHAGQVPRELAAGRGGALAAAGWQVPASAALTRLRRRPGEKPSGLLSWPLAGPLPPGPARWPHICGLLAVARGRHHGAGAGPPGECRCVRPPAGDEGRPLAAGPAGAAGRLRDPGAAGRGDGPAAGHGGRRAVPGPRPAGPPADGDAAAGRPELLQLPAAERGGGHRRGAAAAGQGEHAPAGGAAAAGRAGAGARQ